MSGHEAGNISDGDSSRALMRLPLFSAGVPGSDKQKFTNSRAPGGLISSNP
jgi:hypothetical protein